MWDLRVCVACLATDVRMYSMSAASLLEPYRLLTGIEVQSEGMPQKLCWECAALVNKFNMFKIKCERASVLLQDIYNQQDKISINIWDVRMCAACLSTGVRMYRMSSANLLEPYRLLTGIGVQRQGVLQKLCWECAALVHKFNMFRHKCEKASLLLRDIYNQHDEVSEQDVLRVNREQHNLISSYSVCPIIVFYLDDKEISEENNTKESQEDVLMEPIVKFETNITEKEEDHKEIKLDIDDTELIDDGLIEEDYSQEGLSIVKFETNITRKEEDHREIKLNVDDAELIDDGLVEEDYSQEGLSIVKFETNITRKEEDHREIKLNVDDAELIDDGLVEEDYSQEVLPLVKFESNNTKKEEDHKDIKLNIDDTELINDGLVEEDYSQEVLPLVKFESNNIKKEEDHKDIKLNIDDTELIDDGLVEEDYSQEVLPLVKFESNNIKKEEDHKDIKLNIDDTELIDDGLVEEDYSQEVLPLVKFESNNTKKEEDHKDIKLKIADTHLIEDNLLEEYYSQEIQLESPQMIKHSRNRRQSSNPQQNKRKRERKKAKDFGMKEDLLSQCGEVMETNHIYNANNHGKHRDETRTHLPATRAPCMCEICGKIFRNRGHLNRHSYNHTGERRYKCDMCDKSFSTNQVLHTHIRSHTKEFPYKCDICGLAFTNEFNMKRHKSVHTDATPYACEICGKRFKYSTNVKTHVKYVHLKKPWPKRDRGKKQIQNERRSRDIKRKLLVNT